MLPFAARRPGGALRALPLGATLAVAALLAAPAARAGIFSDDAARQAIIELRKRVDDAEQARAAREGESAKQVEALRRSLLDLSQQIEALRVELAQQRGANEVLARDLAELQRKQKDVQQGLQERVSKLEPQRVVVEGQEFYVDPEEKRQYEEGIAKMRAGDWNAAAAALGGFLKRYPDTGYRPTALYWLGNAQFGQKDFKAAIASFRSLVASTPDHPRAPEALLAVANCHIELKEQKTARKVLEELIKAYPKSEPAQAARERLGGKG